MRLTGDKPTRVETFARAACLTRFAAVHAPRQLSRGFLVRSKAVPLQLER